MGAIGSTSLLKFQQRGLPSNCNAQADSNPMLMVEPSFMPSAIGRNNRGIASDVVSGVGSGVGRTVGGGTAVGAGVGVGTAGTGEGRERGVGIGVAVVSMLSSPTQATAANEETMTNSGTQMSQ